MKFTNSISLKRFNYWSPASLTLFAVSFGLTITMNVGPAWAGGEDLPSISLLADCGRAAYPADRSGRGRPTVDKGVTCIVRTDGCVVDAPFVGGANGAAVWITVRSDRNSPEKRISSVQ